MKTPEEIKLGLELCQSYMGGADDRECCDVCEYQGECNALMVDALAYIGQLEWERDTACLKNHSIETMHMCGVKEE